MAYIDFLRAIGSGEGVIVMADGRVFVKNRFEHLVDGENFNWESEDGETDDSGEKED